MGSIKSKYFKYSKGVFSSLRRPTNQNLPEVQKKIAARLNDLINNQSNLKLTEVQKTFTDEIATNDKVKLKENKIDIAHNIAISVVMEAIVDRMNRPRKKKDEAAEKLTDQFTSSDDSKKTIKEFFEILRDPTVKAWEKLKEADFVVSRLNQGSKNLSPGHSVNLHPNGAT